MDVPKYLNETQDVEVLKCHQFSPHVFLILFICHLLPIAVYYACVISTYPTLTYIDTSTSSIKFGFSLTGDDKVSLSEFQAIFLTCTEMTMDDVTELFNLFASHQGEMDQLESGSGLSGIDEQTYFYNKNAFR